MWHRQAGRFVRKSLEHRVQRGVFLYLWELVAKFSPNQTQMRRKEAIESPELDSNRDFRDRRGTKVRKIGWTGLHT